MTQLWHIIKYMQIFSFSKICCKLWLQLIIITIYSHKMITKNKLSQHLNLGEQKNLNQLIYINLMYNCKASGIL
ncbi:hypothetical protein JHK86_009354 [Glycine max]|nr:hypothetical protein JHK86_009354 [Glycine max]